MQIILNLSRNYLTDCGEDGKASSRLPRAIVVGMRARYGFVDTADMEEMIGILIEPGGFPELFRERADLFFERSIGLEEIWAGPSLTERLCEIPTPVEKLRTLEVLLTGRLHPSTRRSELVDQALHLFREKSFRVAECARSVGVSERRLSQVFREQVGMSPKTWCRIHRFQTAVQALHNGEDVPWTELALRCGYYDQSHFANSSQAAGSGYAARAEKPRWASIFATLALFVMLDGGWFLHQATQSLDSPADATIFPVPPISSPLAHFS